MMLRKPIGMIVWGLGALMLSQTRADEPRASRPNVVLCMADDLGWGDTGYNGHPVLRTPHLDRMAAEGLRFERFYASSPVCSPTRGSCLTGRHPYRYGIPYANTGHMLPDEVTLAEVLREQGYATGHFGKWHLGTLTTKMKDANRGQVGNVRDYSPPWQNGFDACFSTESKVPTWNPMQDPQTGRPYGTHYWTGAEQLVSENLEGDDSRIIMDRVLPFVRSAAQANQPFLAVIWFHAPHLPVVSRPPYTDGYDEHRDYYGCITALDEQMGRLRAELERAGVANNTMLWFCSDNGPEGKSEKQGGRTNGLRGRKRSLYEGGVRVPGLLIWPEQVKSARMIAMPCSTCDYFPTVLAALGYEMPDELARPYDGVNLLPMIDGRMTERPRPIGFESRGQLALTDNRFKIYSGNNGKQFELYDLGEDPGEKNDLAQQHPDTLRAMRKQLEAWRASCHKSAAGDDYRD
ncbi:MAG: sulfatase-like hydrolase/transferase [Planctomycetales bacterium]|nr:sulfatase-like hydrolase/transferase [Planctomycetales bacterium]